MPMVDRQTSGASHSERGAKMRRPPCLARRPRPPRGAEALTPSFNRRIRNMSVGRFQLALRALDLLGGVTSCLLTPPCMLVLGAALPAKF